eukprot:995334-Alexandrium_andersonii.AAC.1
MCPQRVAAHHGATLPGTHDSVKPVCLSEACPEHQYAAPFFHLPGSMVDRACGRRGTGHRERKGVRPPPHGRHAGAPSSR